MRIIAGIARGTPLASVKDDKSVEGARPTLDRVKENYFNAIHFDVIGKNVLDLFAGTGQLGLEALSRGADEAVFIDNNNENIEIIKKNAQKCKLYEKCKVLRYDYSEYINTIKKQKGIKKFGIAFIDPPYDTDYCVDAVKKLIYSDILNDDAVIIAESDKELPEFDERINARIDSRRIYNYGSVLITILRLKKDDPDGEMVV